MQIYIFISKLIKTKNRKYDKIICIKKIIFFVKILGIKEN